MGEVLGGQHEEARLFLEQLDTDESNEIRTDEFLEGVMRLKGNATQKDLLCVQKDVRRVMAQLEVIARSSSSSCKSAVPAAPAALRPFEEAAVPAPVGIDPPRLQDGDAKLGLCVSRPEVV